LLIFAVQKNSVKPKKYRANWLRISIVWIYIAPYTAKQLHPYLQFSVVVHMVKSMILSRNGFKANSIICREYLAISSSYLPIVIMSSLPFIVLATEQVRG
jgi:hypothetical protein